MKIERVGYKVVSLKTLLSTSVRNGYSPVCPEAESGNWVLGLGALNGKGFDPSQKKPAPLNDQKIQDFLLSKGDFLVSRSNTLDKVGRASLFRGEVDNCAYPDLMMRFRVDEKKVNLEYLDTYLRSEKIRHYFQIHAAGSSASMVKITKSILEETPILLLPLPEQEKIASFLGAVDTRLTQLRRKHELLQTYKRGVMQKLFSQQIRFKQDDRSDFPEWEKKKLSDLFKWVRTNSLSRDALSFESGTIQNIHYGDIHKKFKSQFFLRKEEVPYIIDDFFASSIDSEDFCKIGDLVIADASEDYTDIGKVIEIIEVEPNKLVAGLHCFIARPKVRIIVGYSGYLFKSENVRKQIKEIAQGISVLGISKTNLEYLDLPYPCLEEQEKIADFLTAIDRKIETVNRSIGLVEQFKKGLLQKMFI